MFKYSKISPYKIIATGSIVTKDLLQSYKIYAGISAKPLKSNVE
jgi:acetyltransferase-like isoleucine patch superfamily enzyme